MEELEPPIGANISNISGTLDEGVPRELFFDDDPLDAILSGQAPKGPTPADAIEQMRVCTDISAACVKAAAAIAGNHPSEIGNIAESLPAKRRDLLMQAVLRLGADDTRDSVEFLRNLGSALAAAGHDEEAVDVRSRARGKETRVRESRFLQTIAKEPKNSGILNAFAMFLKNECGEFDRAVVYYREALRLAPQDAIIWNNLGVLLMTPLGKIDEAEQAFLRSFELNSNDVTTVSNLACLLHNFTDRQSDAKARFEEAIKLDPHDAGARANYAAFFISHGAYEEAAGHIAIGWKANTTRHDRISARLLFLGLVLEILNQKSGAICIGQLKTLIDNGITHSPWTADKLVARLQQILTSTDYAFASAVLDGIRDWGKLPLLQQFPRWKEQPLIQLDQPWQ